MYTHTQCSGRSFGLKIVYSLLYYTGTVYNNIRSILRTCTFVNVRTYVNYNKRDVKFKDKRSLKTNFTAEVTFPFSKSDNSFAFCPAVCTGNNVKRVRPRISILQKRSRKSNRRRTTGVMLARARQKDAEISLTNYLWIVN